MGCAPPADGNDSSALVLGATPATGTLDVTVTNLWYDRPAAQAVYDALFAWDQETDSYGPFLASGWELNEDRTVLTIDLRDDVVFSDGTKMTSDAVINTLELHPFFFGDWELSPNGEYSLTATSPAPIERQTLQGITGIAIFSPNFEPDELVEAPVGTGPYLLDEEASTVGVELRFVRNPDYWGDVDDYPYDELTVKVYEDSVAAVNALKSGQIDATLVDIGAVPNLEADGFKVTIGSATFFAIQFGDVAGDVLPPLGDVRVRQAINMAFDRETINDALAFGYGDWSSQAFIPVQPAYVEGGDDYYSFDPDRARSLLAEAGYADGFDITIASIANLTEPVEPIVQQSLADIGIRVSYEVFPDFAAWIEGAAELPATLMNIYYINTIKSHLSPVAPFNPWGTIIEGGGELIRLIDTGSAEESKDASHAFGRLALEQALLAPIFRPPVAWASTQEVDLSLDPLSAPIRLSSLRPAD
jgi:peptide/nickel transport system substrate-binding protein